MQYRYLLFLGLLLYVAAVTFLGVELLLTESFPVGLLPVSASLPGRSLLVYLTGAVLISVGVGMLLRIREAGIIAGLVFLLFALLVHGPRWLDNPYDGRVWTALFELVALAGGAFLLTDVYGRSLVSTDMKSYSRILVRYGQSLFASALLVFGGLHFVYGPFIATLIPAWIPGHLFWAYFVGVAFVATGISILLNKQMGLTTSLLGIMFLLWVLLLHAPRVVANPTVEPEWTSLFVALAMSGISLILAGSTVNEILAPKQKNYYR